MCARECAFFFFYYFFQNRKLGKKRENARDLYVGNARASSLIKPTSIFGEKKLCAKLPHTHNTRETIFDFCVYFVKNFELPFYN